MTEISRKMIEIDLGQKGHYYNYLNSRWRVVYLLVRGFRNTYIARLLCVGQLSEKGSEYVPK